MVVGLRPSSWTLCLGDRTVSSGARKNRSDSIHPVLFICGDLGLDLRANIPLRDHSRKRERSYADEEGISASITDVPSIADGD